MSKPDVIVVGAGVLGAWTAFHFQQRGARTQLVDAWEPGHPRATSSDESRVTRCGYGTRRLYTRWAWEALAQWKHWQQQWGVQLFHCLGVLWMHTEENEYTTASVAALREEKIPVEQVSMDELARRFPQISPEGISVAYYEPEGGALSARLAVQTVVNQFVQSGGLFQLARVEPVNGKGENLRQIRLADGTSLSAASYVFACGPWLPQLFPKVVGDLIRVTRQEVFYFGAPPGETRFNAGEFPVWLSGSFYGIPALAGRGVKICEDEVGPPFEPTSGDRVVSVEGLRRVRDYLALRFPALKDAPVVESRVCQYESTPDANLLIDRHPEFRNLWLVGGGSGHSFKLGPKVGSVVAAAVLGEPSAIPPELGLRPRTATAVDKPTLAG
ncbi:MAG TPA: FAD-dependent oxidoreductase [Candidatus Xenobia bacterium]|nr:FAD-dependent oxidoreductase [Candidatus Xenobia bacterium]